jgi:hypothetical protein
MYNSDGAVTAKWEQHTLAKECGLFSFDQTAAKRWTRRSLATEIFRKYFVLAASREQHIWWYNGRWQSCHSRLKDWQLQKHLSGAERYGVRGGKWTNFVAIDLDLHNGDQDVFLDQLRALLADFHGHDGWHFQVADENAGGIHLLRCFREPAQTDHLRFNLRKILHGLDGKHPELASRARKAGMKPLSELEIFPDQQKGFRLPLCSGRTMLLDQPLALVHDRRRKRDVQNVLGYIGWIAREPKQYMPAAQVVAYVQQRLAKPKERTVPAAKTEKTATKSPTASGMAQLGKMKGQYRQKLVAFWTGKESQPDSLNQQIVLLARVLPFYLDEEKAVELVERYIDELPDQSFSDRLAAGNRDEVSRIVRETVKQVYHDNGGQNDPDASTEKLQATVATWKKRGFDPTDKTTWGEAVINRPPLPVNNFLWRDEDVIKLKQIEKLLNSCQETVSAAMKHLLSLVKHHPRELSISYIKQVLASFGLKVGKHGRVNKVMALLTEWKWIYLRAKESWHEKDASGKKRAGRARAYGIGEEMQAMFAESSSITNNNTKASIYIVSPPADPGQENATVELLLTVIKQEATGVSVNNDQHCTKLERKIMSMLNGCADVSCGRCPMWETKS